VTIWSTPEGRTAAAVGAACWAQLCLVPQLAHRAAVLETCTITLAGASAELLQNPRVQEAYLGT
jgi:hypothetical protein